MEQSRTLPLADRIISTTLAVLGFSLIIGASVFAAPAAMAAGWYTSRALVFFACVIAASALAGCSLAPTIRRLRQRAD